MPDAFPGKVPGKEKIMPSDVTRTMQQNLEEITSLLMSETPQAVKTAKNGESVPPAREPRCGPAFPVCPICPGSRPRPDRFPWIPS